MNLFHEFSNKAPNKVFLSIVLGALAGICYAMLIPVVLNSIATETNGLTAVGSKVHTLFSVEISNFSFACLFFALCVIILVSRTASQVLLIRISMAVTTDLRVKLYKRIVSAPVAELDKIGPSKLMTILTDDVKRVVFGGRLLPDMLVSLVTLLGMLGFMLYLNGAAFVFVIEALIFGIITYQIPMYFGARMFMRSRTLLDGLQEGIRGLIYGVKELKLDAKKRENYFEKILLTREQAYVNSERDAFSTTAAAAGYGDLISFFVIGVVAFVFVNYHSVEPQDLVGIIMALLYVTGPVAVILGVMPQIAMAKVSLNKIEELLRKMPEEKTDGKIVPIAAWDTLSFSDVYYKHATASDGKGFTIGPMNFEIKRGEVTFIVGGNGSGKSTLSKVISLHYFPSSGTIKFGNAAVTEESKDSFRQEIGAIFSDYYLFDRLLGNTSKEALAAADVYLKEFGLQDKISISDGVFSTLSLSDGQRKRLALLVAFLEDKPLYLFDEWAADQDPVFKDIFYKEILPDLKARGKAVIVISHDDRYFDVADRVLVMEDGKLVAIKTKGPNQLTAIDPIF
jgi:putative ATP-binding cassette transporter